MVKKSVAQCGPLLLCLMFFALAGGFETTSQPTGQAYGYLTTAKNGGEALGEAVGEFRIVAANILWSKVVDHYHHQFMAQGGEWDKNVSLLPLLKTIIELDPHFTQAYELMGGEILPNTGRLAEGQAVLAEGVKNNPNDWEIDREMALLYAWTSHRPDLALPYARAGLAQADDDFSRRLLGRLCHTLQDEVNAGSKVTDADRPPSPPSAGASSARSLPSASS